MTQSIQELEQELLERFQVELPPGSESREIEKKLLPFTEQLNRNPLKVDWAWYKAALQDAEELWEDRLKVCTDEVRHPDFKPGSTKHCAEELYEVRGHSPRYSPKGTVSVDKEALIQLENAGVDLARMIREAREARAVLSQLQAWGKYVKAGHVQAKWNQAGTPQGRFSCQDPNLQSRVPQIRGTVTPRMDCLFVSVDWSMAEYVVWATLSQDPCLLGIFKSGRDLHEEMGKLCMTLVPKGHPLRNQDVRKVGKTLNFALLYLMRPKTLAGILGIDVDTAMDIMEAYAEKAPVAIAYRDLLVNAFRLTGFVSTKYGRVRTLTTPEEFENLKESEQRGLVKTAWNHHNAGTAAELHKKMTIVVMEAISREFGLDSGIKWVLDMHDEIVLEVPQPLVPRVEKLLEETFGEDVTDGFPMTPTVRTGVNWKQVTG